MEVNTEFDNISKIVEKVLEVDVRARNDDKWLIYKVVSQFTRIYIPFEDFKKIPSFETITRVRRKIQNDQRKFLPTSLDVMRKRRIRQSQVSDWAVGK